MTVSYSGYEGVDGQPGKEWITITGETSTALEMKAFAFEAGEALVEYEWDRVQTTCCLGTAACTGSFSSSISKGSTVDIGSIPTGKKNLRVDLECSSDVDIQLFDLEDTSSFSEGKAIIAYCEEDGCNKGALGNNDGSAESTTYYERTYSYSGYYGVDGNYGNEWVKVSGVLNRELMMKAYGYAAGDAAITYSYYEDYDSGVPIEPSVDFLISRNTAKSNTEAFTDVPADTLIVRRSGTFEVLVAHPDGVLVSAVSASVSGKSGEAEDTTEDYGDQLTFELTQKDVTEVLITGTLSKDAPVGAYTITVQVQGEGTTVYKITAALVVLFNPYSSKDDVYTSKANRVEYVENTEGLVWQGLSDNNNGYTWDYDQFAWANLDRSLNLLRRMPVADRADAALVSRHLTYSVGADVCYGKWGEGSYTTGRPAGGYKCSSTKKCREPDYWTGTTELFELNLLVEKPVQYCQCFVYAALMTTVGRALGIPSRPVTTFQSAHDADKNRAIDKFYKVDPDSGAFDPTDAPDGAHDSVWSFHVWNEYWFDRPTLGAKCSDLGQSSSCANGWQAVDATPQETSMGGSGVAADSAEYQMGPASVKLVKANIDETCRSQDVKYGCFDSEFVISEVNSDVKLWVVDESSANGFKWHEKTRFSTDPWGDEYNTIGLQISTKKKGSISDACRKTDADKDCSADLDDITKQYKYDEPSGPGDPTLDNQGPFNTGRRLKAGRERRLGASSASSASTGVNVNATTSVNFTGIGVSPSAHGMIVNTPGHPHNGLKLKLPFVNAGDATENVTCRFTVTMHDYAGYYWTGYRANSTLAMSEAMSHKLAPGASAECLYEVERSVYRENAAMYLDSIYGLTELDSSEKFYALKVTVTARTGSGYVYETDVTKGLCTPIIGYTLRSGIYCEGNRGIWQEPEWEELSHLDDDNTNCSSSSRVGDGTCDSDLNYDGCWDGGDCCEYSCWGLWGDLIELADDWDDESDDSASWQYQHSCATLNDTATCIDAKVKGYVSYDFVNLPSPVAFGGEGAAEDLGEDICPTLLSNFSQDIAQECELEPCGSGCKKLINETLCGVDDYARIVVDCLEQLYNETLVESCNAPRCAQRTSSSCQCMSSWTWKNYYNDDGADDGSYAYEEYTPEDDCTDDDCRRRKLTSDWPTTNENLTFAGKCVNPALWDGTLHTNDWCAVVPGSCDTDDGNPGSEAMYYDSFNGWWWDNCGSGFINVTSGKYLSLNGSNAYAWDENETKAYTLQYDVAWSGMTAINASNATTDGDGDGDDDTEDGDESDDVIGGLNTAEVSFVVVGCLMGAAGVAAAGWWLTRSYAKPPLSGASAGGPKPVEVEAGAQVMNPVAPNEGL
eukprot:CAMPEP_0205920300 /NCGR_PEP_ID=MMETSP1325-20131115/10981_1 /ASSEMBLY_ACC=CAM_ASM_000708 /TAXON_ID=236786 /ORGANISM="Florenciella sp., Strain RCC1007" /LENGTH=1353 /DNA_ID=CAMNT_0053287977 /DNA_START=80 /DNA_END=4141 /DNA_ORIENTATION=-